MKTTIEVLKDLYAFCEKRQKEINVSQGDKTTGMSKAFEEVKKEIEVKLTVEYALEQDKEISDISVKEFTELLDKLDEEEIKGSLPL